ncbi:hypothetical protein HdK1rev_00094 [Escherichia phage vB_EcoS_HdK1]|nr:hypothetical protein HdK1rev_00094 [Escherichia phage vB_EcoS_HdK1]
MRNQKVKITNAHVKEMFGLGRAYIYAGRRNLSGAGQHD